jgi:hypothetical protein
MAHLFRAAGLDPHMVRSENLTRAGFDQLCREQEPGFVFGINFSPEIAFLCAENRVPYVSWTIDPLTSERFRLYTEPGPLLAFAHRHQLCEQLSTLLPGTGCSYLPLAAPAFRRSPEDPAAIPENLRARLSFVGQSLATEAEAARELLRTLVGGDAIAAGDDWARHLAVTDADQADWRSPVAVPDGIDPETALRTDVREALDGLMAFHLRRSRVAALVRAGIRVWGDEHWATVPGLDYRGFASHGRELSRIYSGSCLNLDLPRTYQRDIVTMRVFDVMACGGALISEPSTDLLSFFRPGEHVLTYRNTDELCRTVDRVLTRPRDLRELAENGRREVLARHLLEHRVQVILERVRGQGWAPGP